MLLHYHHRKRLSNQRLLPARAWKKIVILNQSAHFCLPMLERDDASLCQSIQAAVVFSTTHEFGAIAEAASAILGNSQILILYGPMSSSMPTKPPKEGPK